MNNEQIKSVFEIVKERVKYVLQRLPRVEASGWKVADTTESIESVSVNVTPNERSEAQTISDT